MSNKDIKEEAENLNVGFYEKYGVIDLDGVDGLMATFTGDNAEQEASEWLWMYREHIEQKDKR